MVPGGSVPRGRPLPPGSIAGEGPAAARIPPGTPSRAPIPAPPCADGDDDGGLAPAGSPPLELEPRPSALAETAGALRAPPADGPCLPARRDEAEDGGASSFVADDRAGAGARLPAPAVPPRSAVRGGLPWPPIPGRAARGSRAGAGRDARSTFPLAAAGTTGGSPAADSGARRPAGVAPASVQLLGVGIMTRCFLRVQASARRRRPP